MTPERMMQLSQAIAQKASKLMQQASPAINPETGLIEQPQLPLADKSDFMQMAAIMYEGMAETCQRLNVLTDVMRKAFNAEEQNKQQEQQEQSRGTDSQKTGAGIVFGEDKD